MSLPGYDPNDFDDDEIDESKLEPATDEEIREAIEQVLDEMDEELKEAFMREFEKAETIEERTKVMEKYGMYHGNYID